MRLEREKLSSLIQEHNLRDLTFSQLENLFRNDSILNDHLPDNISQVDPRNGEPTIYVTSRGDRPHDNRPDDIGSHSPQKNCPICQGQTTKIIDYAEISDGFTFINKNLFPVFYPFVQRAGPATGIRPLTGGLHFLQWTSSVHDKDFHNMPLADCIVVMSRLAALEKKLLESAYNDAGCLFKQISITKNYGHLVGGSLIHGHQQIVLMNFLPRRIMENVRFLQEKGEVFSRYLLRENPQWLVIKNYGSAVLLVPYFMRRPYEMMLVLKNSSRKFLHELNTTELRDTAQGWQDAINAIRVIMPEIGRELAYNVIVHNGPGAGLYFEFLPYTQEFGGFELLGIYACQADPHEAAQRIRKILDASA